MNGKLKSYCKKKKNLHFTLDRPLGAMANCRALYVHKLSKTTYIHLPIYSLIKTIIEQYSS